MIALGALFLAFTFCKPAPPQRPAAPVPQTRATVVTIQTTIQPGNKTTSHTLVIANGRARSSDELDTWRLFDLANDRVTFVNDIEKTLRTVDRKRLVEDFRGSLDDPLPDGVPRAQLVPVKAMRTIQGVIATQTVVRLGGYTHEIWIGQHPRIPPQLYSMILASEPSASPLFPVMKSVDEALLNVRGFPLAEHTELVYGNKKMTVDKQVTKVEEKAVPLALLNVAGTYRDVTTK